MFGWQGNSIRIAMEAALCDSSFLEVGVRLYIFLAEWICTLVDPVHRGERLPVPQPLPRAYRAIPEFAVEDMGEFLVFVLRSQPVVLLKVIRELLVANAEAECGRMVGAEFGEDTEGHCDAAG